MKTAIVCAIFVAAVTTSTSKELFFSLLRCGRYGKETKGHDSFDPI
jgi:hypothetical protein